MQEIDYSEQNSCVKKESIIYRFFFYIFSKYKGYTWGNLLDKYLRNVYNYIYDKYLSNKYD